MCGFLVIHSKNNFKDNIEIKNKFKQNLSILQDRGPDESSIVEFDNFLIGFNRLSINNIKTGSQPFFSKCKRYLICFNGEIVNYKELIEFLLQKNIKMTNKNEVEVILELYLHYGEECLSFLKGMFAFVILDKISGKIFAASDRFGIKPIYYGYINNKKCFYITSNFSSLVTTNIIAKKIDHMALEQFISLGQIYDSKTLINNVHDLKNASLLKLENNNLTVKKYWYPSFKKNKIKNYNDLIDEVMDKLKSTINYWKTSEEKLSLCLSDGVDSNILLQLLTSELKNLETFSIDLDPKKVPFEKNKYSNFINFNLKKTLKLFKSFAKKNFILLANPSDLTLFQLYDFIGEKGFKVTFTGEGADEIFGGYPKYQSILKNSYLDKKDYFLKNYINIYGNTINQFSSIYRFQSSLNNFNIQRQLIEKLHKLNIQDKCLFMDQMFWVPTVQKRHDAIGMNFGIEVRPPFLDHEFVNLINSLPVNLKFDIKRRKIIAYEIIKKLSKFKLSYKKHSTPSFIEKIFLDKKELNQFLESFRYGILNKFFHFDKFLKLLEKNKKNFDNVHIIFWRFYMLNELLKGK